MPGVREVGRLRCALVCVHLDASMHVWNSCLVQCVGGSKEEHGGSWQRGDGAGKRPVA